MGRIVDPSNDDWIVLLRCRKDGKEWTRVIGVNAASTREQAVAIAHTHVNPLRTVRDGTACLVTDLAICRMWQFKARRMAKDASIAIKSQVERASRVGNRQSRTSRVGQR